MNASQQDGSFPTPSSRTQHERSLFLFGSPRLERSGESVAIDRHKALALLAYLAMSGQRHSRDVLATMLWPDYDQSRARAAVRRALASLTKALPGDWWDVDRETIRLQRDPAGLLSQAGFWLDVDQFHALLARCRSHGHPEAEVCAECLSPLTDAVVLYRGDFMAGFTLRDSPDFDEWQFTQTEDLRRELASALERLVRGHTTRREFELALSYARRWLALDPLDEQAHCQLMQLYVWAGRPHAALRQFGECTRVLERELGVPPQETTVQLYEAIKEHQELSSPPAAYPGLSDQMTRVGQPNRLVPHSPSMEPRPGPVHAPAPVDRPTLPLDRIVGGWLVGRERELAQASALWQRVLAGETHMLLVSGEPGIGKTRLVRELTVMAEASGASVLVGECYAEGGAPYAPIAHFIREHLGGQRGAAVDLDLPGYIMADLITLAPDLRPRYPDVPPNPRLDPQSEQQRLFDSVVALCGALAQAAHAPLLLLVEDVHWADNGTLFLLRHLARRSRGAKLPLLTVVTYRDTEAELENARTLKEVLLALNRERLAEPLKLPRLNREQTREMLAALLATGGDISPEFLDGVYSETEGNPFFTEEVCKALVEEGQLYYAGGRWRRTDIANLVIPQSVRATILVRVERLPALVQETLRLAAMLGRTFDFDLLAGASDVDAEAVSAALEHAGQAQLITEAGRAGHLRFTFTHALIPFTVRERLSGLRRQQLHRRVAQVIEARRPGDVEALAYHFTAAGERTQAVEYARRAAVRARAMYAYEAAAQHLYTALDLLEAGEAGEMQLALLEELADLHGLLGEGTRAIPLYQEALDRWRSIVGTDKWIAVRLYRKIGETTTSMNRFADIQRHIPVSRAGLAAGLALTQGEPPSLETVRLLRTRSRDAAWYAGAAVDWDAAERYARAAVTMAEQLDAPVERSSALEVLTAVYGGRGLLRERLQLCLQRLELSRDPRFIDPRERINILFQTGFALLDVGDYAHALPHLQEAEDLARQIRDIPRQADAWMRQAQCYLRLDRWDDLLRIEDKLRALQPSYAFERFGVLVCLHIAFNASVRALRGEIDRAETLRQEAYDTMCLIAGPPEQWVRNQHW